MVNKKDDGGINMFIRNAFLHLRTTKDISDDNEVKKLLEQWAEIFNKQKKEYNINLYALNEVRLWSSDDTRFERLIYLLQRGRAVNQLVVFHIDNEKQFEKIKNTKLYNTILGNTIDLEEEDGSVCIKITQ